MHFKHFSIGRTGTVLVLIQTYITDVDGIGLGQFKGGGVRWQVNGELIFIPDFLIFPLPVRKQNINFIILTHSFIQIFAQHISCYFYIR